MESKFDLIKSPQWDSCKFCGAKDNIKTLQMTFDGGCQGCLVTMCQKCAKDMVKMVSRWTNMVSE